MSLSRLTASDRKRIVTRLSQSVETSLLEGVLSSQGVYLAFQRDLLGLEPDERHQRLCEFVVLVLGDNLLAEEPVRQALTKASKVESPSAWKPGTADAIRFCESLELPCALAGVQAPPAPAPVERLGASPRLPPMMDYQEEVYSRCTDGLRQETSQLLSLPTGGGKTRVATEIVRHWHSTAPSSVTTLWLAHTEELCEQAANCLVQIWNHYGGPLPTTLMRAWGRNTKKLYGGTEFLDASSSPPGAFHSIVVTTPITATKLLRTNLEGALGEAFERVGLIVIDEAHRAAADTYKDVINAAKGSKRRVNVIGLSATPVRETYASRQFEGTRDLAALFPTLVEPEKTLGKDESPVSVLQKRGILAPLKIARLGGPKIGLRELAKQIAKEQRRTKREEPGLFFAASAAEARAMAAHLNQLGVVAEAITAQSTSAERQVLVQQLRDGKISVLCNCEILTTGFDAPNISNIYLARSTNSPVLYKQIVGRGLRGPAFGGSSECRLFLCGITLPFEADPNTSSFARAVWQNSARATD